MNSILLPLISGLLTTLAFPTTIGGWLLPNLGWLAWLSLVPWALSLRQARPSEAFRRTFFFSLILYSGSMGWVFIAMTTYGHLSWVASLGAMLLFHAILAVSHSAGAALAVWIASRLRSSVLAVLPLTWTAFELQRNYWPSGGCSWSALGYTQAGNPILVQAADLFGVNGLTAAIVIVNAALAALVAKIFRLGPLARAEGRGLPWAAVGVMVFLTVYGAIRLSQVRRDVAAAPKARIALLQGNIPQDVKYDRNFADSILETYTTMTREADAEGVDLIVWPEASYPYNVPIHSRVFPPGLAGIRAPLVIGVVGEGMEKGDVYHTNSAWLIRPQDGMVVGRYDKTHLVPLGEYVPFGRLLWFAHKLVPEIGDFRPGRTYPLLVTPKLAMAPLICFEDLFPEIARNLAKKGVDLFVNITNDAWYGNSPAVYQHFDLSRMRAVEHRRSVIRATNTGLSGFIDPTGRSYETRPQWERHVIVGEAPIASGFSLYAHTGDFFEFLIVALTIGLVAFAGSKRVNSAISLT